MNEHEQLSRFIQDLGEQIRECRLESARLNSKADILRHVQMKLESIFDDNANVIHQSMGSPYGSILPVP